MLFFVTITAYSLPIIPLCLRVQTRCTNGWCCRCAKPGIPSIRDCFTVGNGVDCAWIADNESVRKCNLGGGVIE